ncbi:F-box only protein 24 [Gopherus flavomarginatus]|uniref:F-box only protein 24 n=1 Tax=Gopherus flavomarginatus TaxID=286002 RepID=UPI0021CC3785|nr:F-box only protein 24 [Gopherus flavomarginatus]
MSRGAGRAGQGPRWPRRGQRCGSLQRLPSGRSRVPGARAGMGDRRTARRQRHRRLQCGSRLSGGDEAMGAKRPRCSQGLVGTEGRTDLGGSAPILRLPPELLDHIVSFLPVRDVVALGQTCHYLRQACDSEGVWRRVCRRLCPRLRQEGTAGARPWKRAAILNYTKGLYFQTFGGRRRYLNKSVAPLLSHGYRKFLPTKEHVFVLDHGGTLFFLRNALVSSAPGHLQWRRACRCVVLCRNAKDFTTDPRSDAGYRKYVYVLAVREPAAGAGWACDCVEVYLQASGQRVFKMTFHAAMRFRQLVLVGQETERALLLLTEEGKIYSLLVNETQLDQPRSYTVQLALRKVSRSLPHLAVRAMTSNQSSAAFLTDKGAVYFEVHSPGVYRDLFGTLHAFDPLDLQMPLALALPAKVLSCALGYNHLGLLDEFGRLFMQGSNRFGQLGTGDKIDRGEPTLVHGLKCPLDVWCGLNHSLALVRSRELGQAVLGCGCGAGGRLPGWPKGSASFVKLQVKVPLCASSLCSTRECLYLLSSHDIEGGPAYRELPPSRAPPPPESPGTQACEQYLSQLQGCPTLAGRLAKVREAVGALPLPPCQKDFLWEALELIRRSARPRSPPACS